MALRKSEARRKSGRPADVRAGCEHHRVHQTHAVRRGQPAARNSGARQNQQKPQSIRGMASPTGHQVHDRLDRLLP